MCVALVYCVVDVSLQDREVCGSKPGGVTIRIAVNPWARLFPHTVYKVGALNFDRTFVVVKT